MTVGIGLAETMTIRVLEPLRISTIVLYIVPGSMNISKAELRQTINWWCIGGFGLLFLSHRRLQWLQTRIDCSMDQQRTIVPISLIWFSGFDALERKLHCNLAEGWLAFVSQIWSSLIPIALLWYFIILGIFCDHQMSILVNVNSTMGLENGSVP